MSAGDAAWMLISTALVVFMVPGLALFYGGMVRSKNVGNMLMMNLAAIAIVPVIWVLFTYSLGNSGGGENEGFFGGDLIGNFDAIGLSDISGTDLIGVAFFMTFASITPALIAGAVADRMKFSAWTLFVLLWSILVYTPITYWVYTGWHHTVLDPAALDFAGGTAIHINAGVAALVLALVLGKRKGLGTEDMAPHNLTLLLIGTGILWFGWFGFNAGSAGAADGVAAQALINTFVAAATGMVGWAGIEWIRDGHATILGAASGIVAGLVAITPAAGYVSVLPALLFGLVAGVLCYYAIQLKDRFGYDDSLDVVGIHGVGGLIGGLMLGLFADSGVNESGTDGLFYGQPSFLLSQIIAMASVIAFSIAVTYVIAIALDKTIGLRVDEEDEYVGLDISQHSETVYANERRLRA
ncbi:MAG: ammonium transporter [Acidimicrobiales bacterium]|nr:ammonium transporter [Acidimicrobiales bacterium]RZV46299.1 MAG: ammonium transporter [Acidimicrobiales bacterium]